MHLTEQEKKNVYYLYISVGWNISLQYKRVLYFISYLVGWRTDIKVAGSVWKSNNNLAFLLL